MKNYLLAAIMILSSVGIATAGFSSTDFPDYTYITGGGYVYGCVQMTPSNSTKEVKAKLNIDVGNLNELQTYYMSRNNCLDGAYAYFPYERNLFVHTSDLRDAQAREFMVSNLNRFYEVFSSSDDFRKGIGILNAEDWVEYKAVLGNTPTNNANHYLQYDTVRGVDYSKEASAFYYSIAVDDATGMNNFYNDGTSSFASDSSFRSVGLPPPSSLSNPQILSSVGRRCNGNYRCVTETALDVDTKQNYASAFFAWSDDLNYYYYPYYIEKAEYVIKGYSNANKTTQTFYKKGTITPTSTRIKFPAYGSGSTRTQEFTVIDDVFNFGTQLIFDGKLATLPSDAPYATADITVFFARNPYYRHENPADATWTLRNITEYNWLGSNPPDCDNLQFASSLCDTLPTQSKGMILTHTININMSSGTTDLPITPPTQVNNNTPQSNWNSTAPSNSTSGGSTNTGIGGGAVGSGGNGTGVDWVYDPNQGGGLQGQIGYAVGRIGIRNKASFFENLQEISNTILIMLLTIFTLLVLALSLYLFVIMIPSGYRKFLNALKELGDMRWK